MEFYQGEEMPDLMSVLEEKEHEIDFFQAVSLLEEYYSAHEPKLDPLNAGNIHFLSDTGVAFPPGDITAITHDTDTDQTRIHCAFMGLLGVSSPLPHYFTEYATKHEEETTLTDFLNIFNHRMYVFFYRAWKKYCSITRSVEAASGSMVGNIGYLAGQGENQSPEKKRLTAYAGLLSLPIRSAEGLRTIVSDFFNAIPVEIQQWVPRWAAVHDLKKIGSDSVLGKTTMLGTHILDMSGKFRVVIGPLDQNMFKTFLPDTPNIAEVKKIIRLYCTDPLEFDIEVRLKPTELTPVVLGKNDAPLGITSSCSVSHEKTEPYSIVIQ